MLISSVFLFLFIEKLDFNQKIYQICFFTPYKQLRDYLVSVLIERQKLNDTELEIIEYLRKLELAYPCRSFDDAKKQITHFRLTFAF